MPLTKPELLALAASARTMMTADGAITEGEFDIVSRFAPRLGLTNAKWEAVWDEAVRTIPATRAMEAAVQVTRREAREQIYALLYELATDGAIADPEWDLLEWLDRNWS